MKVIQFLIPILILSCEVGSQTDLSNKEDYTIVEDEALEHDGTQASLTADFTKPQKLKVDDSVGLGESAAVFRPGSISVSSEISMEEGIDIVDAGTTDELGLQEDYVPYSKPLNISSSSEIDGTVPLSIALEMNTDLGLLNAAGKIFIAIYVLETPSGPKIGIVPTADIFVEGSLASFDFLTEGTYTKASFQLAAFEFSGALTKEQQTERAIQPRSAEPSEKAPTTDENSEEEIDNDNLEGTEAEEQLSEEAKSDDSLKCPENIDESKILIDTEICGVEGKLDLRELREENIVEGKTIAGIKGTFRSDSYSKCTSAGQEGCIATSTFKTMDLSAKDSGGAVDINSSLFSARIKSASYFEYWDENGNRHINRGDEDLVESNIADSAEIFGISGNSGSSLDCSSIPFGTWILVPGNPDYGTNDFCVMKYEAKNNAGLPTSTASNTPWTNIDQQDARTKCASLGKGYHLITNDEWMTIATNAAAQDTNWEGGSVGSMEMARGHSDYNPPEICSADTIDSNSYVESGCTASTSGVFNQRRTHHLSNGHIIWDLAGNVWEWTGYFNDEDKPSPSASWTSFMNVSGTSTMPLSDLVPQIAIDNSWGSAESIGKFYPGNQYSGGALARGGTSTSASMAGVFSANMYFSPNSSYANLGFRCSNSRP